MVFSNGDVYVGGVDEATDMGSGPGGEYRFHASGDVVRAAFENGLASGPALVHRANGDVFRGAMARDEWVEGTYDYAAPVALRAQPHQQPQAKRFRGSFRAGLPSGVGTLEFANGDAYEGAFEAGKPHGTGTYVYANGDRLAGRFNAGRPTHGVFASALGTKYVGEFGTGTPSAPTGSNAVRFHGVGRAEFRNGDSYEGSWRDGMFCGEGVYSTASTGMRLSCSAWNDDRPGGAAQVVFGDGTRFSGAFVNGKLRSGTLTTARGEVFESLDVAEGGFRYPNQARSSRVWVEFPRPKGEEVAGPSVVVGVAKKKVVVVAPPAGLAASPLKAWLGEAGRDRVMSEWVEQSAADGAAVVREGLSRAMREEASAVVVCVVPNIGDAASFAPTSPAGSADPISTCAVLSWSREALTAELAWPLSSAPTKLSAGSLEELRASTATRLLSRLQSADAPPRACVLVLRDSATPPHEGDADAVEWLLRELQRSSLPRTAVTVVVATPVAAERNSPLIAAIIRYLQLSS